MATTKQIQPMTNKTVHTTVTKLTKSQVSMAKTALPIATPSLQEEHITNNAKYKRQGQQQQQ